MIYKTAVYLSNVLIKNRVAEEQLRELYIYGIELLCSSIICIIIVSIIGFSFGKSIQAWLFFLEFIALRQVTGDYHANTYLKCNLSFLAVIIGVLLFAEFCAIDSIIYLIIGYFNIAVLLICSPIEHDNKPLKSKKKYLYRWISIIISTIVYFLAVHISNYRGIYMGTIFSVDILLLIEYVRRVKKMKTFKKYSQILLAKMAFAAARKANGSASWFACHQPKEPTELLECYDKKGTLLRSKKSKGTIG